MYFESHDAGISSITSDYGSDTAYGTSKQVTPFGKRTSKFVVRLTVNNSPSVVEADDQMLELWKATVPNDSIALTAAKAYKRITAPARYHQVGPERPPNPYQRFLEDLK